MAFGGLIVFSGALCFVLEQNWFMHLGVYVKVPLYGILGISISYALTFAIVDLVNYLSSYVPYFTRTPVDNSEQILAVMGFSVLMGGVFGVIFGVMDIEDEIKYHDKLSLMKEELYCYPIGASIGFLCGCINDYLQRQYIKQLETFDDEI